MEYSPVAFFAYNRPYHTFRSLNQLSLNKEAINTELYVFIDGHKKNSEIHLIDNVEKIVKSFISKFKSIKIHRSSENLSLGTSFYRGLNEVFSKKETVIFLEDDVLVSKNFLSYMNRSLSIYADKKEVWHISSYMYPVNVKSEFDCFFMRSMMCWGFGTWKDRWSQFINDPLATDPFYIMNKFDKKMIRELDLNLRKSTHWFQIKYNANGKLNNTWAIFWHCYIFMNKGLCLTPIKTLCKNIGHDFSGENCFYVKDFENVSINENLITKFPNIIEENNSCVNAIREYLRNQNHIFRRISRKLNKFRYSIF